MRASSLSIGRIFGIEVRVHASWLLAFFFLTWSLAGGYFSFVAPRQTGFGTPLLLAAISTVLLFVCVLVHELSHSLVARALGMRVRDITLFIFGGVSNIMGEARTARDEFLISAVGPLTSLVLAGVFWLATLAAGGVPGYGLLFAPTRGLPTPSGLGAVLGYLAIVNLLLGLFNLLPAFPLDGGRVLRSILWAITRRFDRATVIAASIGLVFAILLGALGVLRILVLGDVIGGLWTIFIAWFLGQAASASRHDLRLRQALQDVRVSDVMAPTPPVAEAGTNLQHAVYGQLLGSGGRRLLVVRDGTPIGLIDPASIGRAARDRWPETRVEEVMRPLPDPVTPATEVAEILGRLAESATLPVVADGHLVGVVELAHVLRYAQLREELHVPLNAPRHATV